MTTEQRHDMHVLDSETTQYVSIYFPDVGTLTVTYETRPFANGEKRPVISINFPTDKLDIIDEHGNDREIS